MAVVKIPVENRTISDPNEIAAYLAGIGIDYERWDQLPINSNSSNEEILSICSEKIENLKDIKGYADVDVVNVDSDYNREHLHDEDEARFIIEGGGVYYLNPGKNPVCSLELESGDFIRIPCGVRHWFKLDENHLHIRALRLFQDPEGWTPYYTDSGIEDQY